MFRKCLPLFLVIALIPSLFACGAPVEKDEQEAVIEEEEVVEQGIVEEQELVKEDIEEAVEADFEADVVEGQAPASITFINNSTNADECLWDFGDGTSMTTTPDEPVTHEYTKVGTHTVTLTAIKKGAPTVTDTATLTIRIDHGPLARVVLNTETVRLGLGQTATCTAEATDVYDNPIPEARFTWEAAEGAGAVDAGGVFTAAMQAGEYPQGIVAIATLDGNTVTAAAAVTVALFPDINLDAVIREALGKLPGQKITTDELLNLRHYLTAGKRGIIVLTGMERCTNLNEIDFSENQISDVTPLANLQYLTSLDLSWNQINDITALIDLPNLRSLDLSLNPMSDVAPLTDFPNLISLSFSGNEVGDITALSRSKSRQSLNQLDLSDNQISDITSLASFVTLCTLNLSGNQISNMAILTRLSILQSLDLSENQIYDITALANFTGLKSIDLSGNQISDISSLEISLDLSLNLYSLYLADNQISDISPLISLTNLTHLSLEGNPLNTESVEVYIPQLEQRGVKVSW